jgi:hypothetical protein
VFTITVNPTPSLNVLNPPAICSGTFNYTPASNVAGTIYSWSRSLIAGITQGATSGSGIINEVLTNTTNAAIPVTYIYTLTANGCVNTQNVIVSIKPTPTVNPITNQTTWCLASRYQLENMGSDGFIIDEASMVSKEIHEDLLSFKMPIIYVGDHGQLEPIGSKFNLMENPMYRLETVHRNAGEIAHFAEHLRKGNPAKTFKCEKKVQIIEESHIQDRHLASVDQIICAFNKTRVKLNQRVREEKKIDFTFVAKGEKIICLRNNRKFGLFNGMQGIIKKVRNNEKFDFDYWGQWHCWANFNKII